MLVLIIAIIMAIHALGRLEYRPMPSSDSGGTTAGDG